MSSPVERVKNFLEEEEEEGLLENGEVVRACEKIYKAAEDAVKVLVKTHAPEIYRDVESRGRWTVSFTKGNLCNLVVIMQCKHIPQSLYLLCLLYLQYG